MDIERLFKLKAPCADCPFLKGLDGFLHPGRLDEIKSDLIMNDQAPFFCHKTVDYIDGMDDEGEYEPQGEESYCAGSMVFMHANSRWNVPMRLGYVFRLFTPESLERFIPIINVDLPPVMAAALEHEGVDANRSVADDMVGECANE